MPMFGDHKPHPFLQEKYNTRYPEFSPDTKWVTYTSYEAGHPQVYIVAFPNPGGRFLVGDGIGGVWTRNGKEILYMDENVRIASVEVTAHGDSIELGKPQALFSAQPGLFQASPDGNHLLLLQAPLQNSPSLTLVVNWLQELKK
jgi:eukaryotic-like serine/threonine-protein kinase